MASIHDYTDVTLDLSTVTLGELAAVEMASGKTYGQLLLSTMSRKMVAVFIHELRHSAQPLSWKEIGNLRVLDVSSSMQLSDSAETPAK